MNAMNAMTSMGGLRRMGVAGGLGLLMLIGSAWAAWVWLPRQQAMAQDLGSQGRRMRYELQLKVPQAERADSGVAASPKQAWQTVWDGLPDAGQRAALQSNVLASAARQGLRISTVQYRGAVQPWSARDGQVLWRQRITMPVEGAYPALRAWMAQMLKEPALAVDAIDIQREDASRDQVKGRVSVSLYWRQAVGARP